MEYLASQMNVIEAAGLVFGIVCVVLLIRQNILTWPFGIAYVLVSFYVFYQARLYADLILHVFFLWMNIYGWYYWLAGKRGEDDDLQVTKESATTLLQLGIISILGIAVCGFLLDRYTNADLAYWDSSTTVLSLSAMWLTARKKIESWHGWLVVDILATGIYFYKGLYFYMVLYLIYVGMAIAGYLSWKASMEAEERSMSAVYNA